MSPEHMKRARSHGEADDDAISTEGSPSREKRFVFQSLLDALDEAEMTPASTTTGNSQHFDGKATTLKQGAHNKESRTFTEGTWSTNKQDVRETLPQAAANLRNIEYSVNENGEMHPDNRGKDKREFQKQRRIEKAKRRREQREQIKADGVPHESCPPPRTPRKKQKKKQGKQGKQGKQEKQNSPAKDLESLRSQVKESIGTRVRAKNEANRSMPQSQAPRQKSAPKIQHQMRHNSNNHISNQPHLMHIYTAQDQGTQYYGSQNQGFQYQGLGQGIWPLPFVPGVEARPGNTPLLNLDQSFNNMHIGGPQPQAHQYNSFPMVNQSFPFLFPFFNPPIANGAGYATGPYVQTPSNFAQRNSIHTTAQNNATRSGAFGHPPRPTNPDLDVVEPPVAPIPKDEYLGQAALAPEQLLKPQPLLIISDINGTLISRKRGANFSPRPGLPSFISYLLDSDAAASASKDLTLMIWTSARRNTAQKIVNELFTRSEQSRIAALWTREMLDLNPAQYQAKTQVYKKLERVWADENIQRRHPNYSNGGRWSQSNTILIDDSTEKAKSEPYNLIHIPELTPLTLRREQAEAGINRKKALAQKMYVKTQRSGPEYAAFNPAEPHEHLRDSSKKSNEADKPGTMVLQHVAQYIHTARWFSDVSAFIKTRPFNVHLGTMATDDRLDEFHASDDEYISDEGNEPGDATLGRSGGVLV